MSGQDTQTAAGAASSEPFDAAAFRFAPPPARARPVASWRQGVLLAVLIVHALVLLRLLEEPASEPIATEALRIEFISVPRDASPPAPPSPPPARDRAQPPPPRQAPVPAARPRAAALRAVEVPPSRPAADAAPSTTASAEVRLFDESGAIRVPESALDALRRNASDDRVFDYQIAGLAKARTAFDRAAPLIYEPSRFEAGMRPDPGMLTELLERAVSESTMSISIPFPGDPSRRIVCKVAVLAVSGGCGIAGGFTGFVEEDDPDTLSEEEEQQCSAWWEKITSTGEQGTWLQTRALYDANCRKPRDTRPKPPSTEDGASRNQ